MSKGRGFKTRTKSNYKGVIGIEEQGVMQWRATFSLNGRRREKFFELERDAALQYDKWCIENQKEPKNILKRK
jgi:hypothetical protein